MARMRRERTPSIDCKLVARMVDAAFTGALLGRESTSKLIGVMESLAECMRTENAIRDQQTIREICEQIEKAWAEKYPKAGNVG